MKIRYFVTIGAVYALMGLGVLAVEAQQFDVKLGWSGIDPNIANVFAEVIETLPDGTATLRNVKLDPMLHPDGTYFTYLPVDTAAVIRLYQRNGKYPFVCENYSPPSEAVLVTLPIPTGCDRCPAKPCVP